MNNEELQHMRHSGAHLLAAAVQRLYPDVKLAVGPAIENGFYHDLDFGDTKISDADLPKIEKEMNRLKKEAVPFEKVEMTIKEGKKFLKKRNQPYTLSLLEDIEKLGSTVKGEQGEEKKKGEDEIVTFYKNGEFINMCRGGHLDNFGQVGAFKLTSVAGAYFRGNEKNPMLTRIYVACFPTQEELDKYLNMQEEAKKRDHRKIGKDLDLFVFSELVGKGLPLFTPKGTVLRELLNQFSQDLRLKRGFQKVWIPHITKKELYETSGHWAKFGNELFLVKSQETNDQMVMKPMNCPHHQQIYASKPRNYKDLPIKYLETTTIYRDEKAGELLGLSRVRSVTQDDSHTFCTPEQIEEVYSMLIDIVKEFYGVINMKYRARISFMDPKTPEKYIGEPELWEKAQNILLDIAKAHNLDYYIAEGEAAFYGPKIDFMVEDALGREWQLATPQLDFVQPGRFGLTYTDKEGKEQTPVMIHFALMGSLERFLSVYIEHTAGHFPFWLAPEQVRILTINDNVLDYVEKIKVILSDVSLMEPVRYNTIRYEVDQRSESLGKKIRDAELQKIPVLLIVGPKDQEANQVSIRTKQGESKVGIDELKQFVEQYS